MAEFPSNSKQLIVNTGTSLPARRKKDAISDDGLLDLVGRIQMETEPSVPVSVCKLRCGVSQIFSFPPYSLLT